MILVFNAVGLLRQQLPQDVRIHGIITRGGDAPNIIPTPSFDAVYRCALESLGETVPPDDNRSLGSSDVGNVSQVIPVIQPMIAISDTQVAGHSIEKVAACRLEKGLQSIALGAKALALTALELIQNPALLERIKRDHAAAVAAQAQA